MPSYLSPTIDDLKRVSDQDGVEIFAQVIRAELGRLKLSGHLLNCTLNIHAPDGGIDAELPDLENEQITFIPKGKSFFQIKTGQNFNLDSESDQKKILFNEKRTDLNRRVKKCFEENGTLVIVTFGWDGPYNETELKEKFKNTLESFTKEYPNAKFEFLVINQLSGIIQNIPALSLRLSNLSHSSLFTHKQWSNDREFQQVLITSGELDVIINEITAGIGSNKYIRLLGDAGVGKSRLALEACRDDDVRELVLYFHNSEAFYNDVLSKVIRHEGEEKAAIIVIDECNLSNHRRLVDEYQNNTSEKIRFITIYNEREASIDETVIFYIDKAPDTVISEIIQSYHIPKDTADQYVPGCGGSPRVAHMLGLNLHEFPDDPLERKNFGQLWMRTIAGYDDQTTQEVKNRIDLLASLSLFKRFGYEGSFKDEFKYIYTHIIDKITNISEASAYDTIDYLRGRKILQGDKTIYITPDLLHIWLWRYWWGKYKNRISLIDVAKGMPGQILEWFFEMFVHARNVPEAEDLVKELFSDNESWNNSPIFNTPLGQNILSNLTVAFPDITLDYFKKKINDQPREELLKFTTGRREVVWALEKIVRWRQYFNDAARILLNLAAAENESYGNNAAGVFTGLFSHAPSPLAPTEATPADRYPILEEIMGGNDEVLLKLGLDAIGVGLQSKNFTAFSSGDRPFVPQPQLWRPSEFSEVIESYQRIWTLLVNSLDSLKGEHLNHAIKIIINKSTDVASFDAIHHSVIETLRMIAEEYQAFKKDVLRHVSKVIHYASSWRVSHLDDWQKLYNDLLGEDYHDRLERWVGMMLLEDEYDKEGRDIEGVKSEIASLAREAIATPEILQPELSWLVTAKAGRSFQFGYALGATDKTRSFLAPILEAQRKIEEAPSTTMIGGYLRAVKADDVKTWEEITKNISADESIQKYFPEIVWRTGVNDDTAAIISAMLERGVIDYHSLRHFLYGGDLQQLKEETINQWLEYLIGTDEDEAVAIAVELAGTYYLDKESVHTFPGELIFRLVTHPALHQRFSKNIGGQLLEYEWAKLSKKLFRQNEEFRSELISLYLASWRLRESILSNHRYDAEEVFDEFAELDSSLTWEKLSEVFESPLGFEFHLISNWLRGSGIRSKVQASIWYFNSAQIWEWVDENIKDRAWIVADLIPPTLESNEEGFCWAKEVLVRYGSDDDVRNELHSNFYSESWTGPASSHYLKHKKEAESIKEKETNPNVLQWLEERIKSLDGRIKEAMDEEERRGY